MNRMVFAVVILLIIGACLPSNLPFTIGQPTVDGSALTQCSIPSVPSETATLPPTATLIPITDTSAPSATFTETPTSSPVPNLTTTFATATEFAGASGEATATLVAVDAGTTTSTPSHLTYGTLPPENNPF